MGCGQRPGEAGDADFGIAGGREVGSSTRTAGAEEGPSWTLIDELFHEIDRWIEAGMPRPAPRPAGALAMAEASLIL